MAPNGKRETGMILQKLTDIDENVKELKKDVKKLTGDTILQGERIRNVEILASNNKGKIEKVDNTVWGIRLQLAGIAAVVGSAAGLVGHTIMNFFNGLGL